MACGIEFVDWVVKLGKGVGELSLWFSYDKPQRNRNNIIDLLRATPVKASAKDDEKICSRMKI